MELVTERFVGKCAERVTVLSQLISALENPQVDAIIISADIVLDGRPLPPITRTMILRGICPDGCTLDASGRSRHLSIGSNLDGLPGHVVLENLILRNGRITATFEVGIITSQPAVLSPKCHVSIVHVHTQFLAC
jgi:hypothetical protein